MCGRQLGKNINSYGMEVLAHLAPVSSYPSLCIFHGWVGITREAILSYLLVICCLGGVDSLLQACQLWPGNAGETCYSIHVSCHRFVFALCCTELRNAVAMCTAHPRQVQSSAAAPTCKQKQY